LWWLEGGWCKPRVPPKIAKIRVRIIRVCRINSVLIRMGRLESPYDPSLVINEPRTQVPSPRYVTNEPRTQVPSPPPPLVKTSLRRRIGQALTNRGSVTDRKSGGQKKSKSSSLSSSLFKCGCVGPTPPSFSAGSQQL